MPAPRLALHAAFVSLLLLAALWFPLPLYLISLAAFGLMHVICEMGFLRSRYAARWSLGWWLALWAVLLLQAGMRGAVWLGGISALAGQVVDLLALLLLALVVGLAPSGAGWKVRLAGLILGGGVVWLLAQGDILEVLLLLAMAHNFTPLAMAWDLAREHSPSRPVAWAVSGLFILPLLVAGSGWTGAVIPNPAVPYSPLLDGQLPPEWGGAYRQALLSAIVLAQCLHYYSVIYLLPRAQAQRTGISGSTAVARLVVLALVGLMLGYYVSDYSAARKLYAVAAGIHAWLEWPVLLMAFLCVAAKRTPAPAAASCRAHGR